MSDEQVQPPSEVEPIPEIAPYARKEFLTDLVAVCVKHGLCLDCDSQANFQVAFFSESLAEKILGAIAQDPGAPTNRVPFWSAVINLETYFSVVMYTPQALLPPHVVIPEGYIDRIMRFFRNKSGRSFTVTLSPDERRIQMVTSTLIKVIFVPSMSRKWQPTLIA